ncbi:conjugal transfer protein TraB [Acidithiobacillus montserratensis]|uniref:Conjugal transfer protein TraB n=1 Tax=Acidithiobacillus montserratensis TaxID=2729135 RepID=A0ACD5HIX4_9PROT|nr:conjugal transfer protein TraB [Acidithiobacillus montserratensis]MBU2746582.1 conjugal transfer protein TraB [Acidithiobacillus montserratensis]
MTWKSKAALPFAFLLGGMIGLLAWPCAIGLAPLALVALPFWGRRHWAAPFLSMLGYHLATTYGLIHGTDDFFPHAGLLLGLGFWSGSSLLFALPYLFYTPLSLWLSTITPKAVAAITTTVLLSAISTILPPLGLVGWTSPWIGALPGGWWAMLLVLLAVGFVGKNKLSIADIPAWILISVLLWGAFFLRDHLWLAGIVAVGFLVFSFALDTFPSATIFTIDVLHEGRLGAVIGCLLFATMLPHTAPKLPAHWTAINAKYGELSGLSYVEASMKLAPQVLHDFRHGSQVVLTPESIAGPWYVGTKAVWKPVLDYTASHHGKVALIGADIPNATGGLIDALVEMHDGKETILPDRIPVPFSMWHPWRPFQSFPMRVFGKPEIGQVGKTRIGYLICYEQLLMWPALGLIGEHMQVLLAPANDWWAEGTDIPAIQRASAKAWGNFLGVPVLFAVNR